VDWVLPIYEEKKQSSKISCYCPFKCWCTVNQKNGQPTGMYIWKRAKETPSAKTVWQRAVLKHYKYILSLQQVKQTKWQVKDRPMCTLCIYGKAYKTKILSWKSIPRYLCTGTVAQFLVPYKSRGALIITPLYTVTLKKIGNFYQQGNVPNLWK